MDEQTLLQQQIWQNPDDELPVLMYADWLEEHKQKDMAEFLRVESQLRQITPDQPEAYELLAQRDALGWTLPDEAVRTYSRYVDYNFLYPWSPHSSPAYVLRGNPNPASALRQLEQHRRQSLRRSLEIILSADGPSRQLLASLPLVGDFDILTLRIISPNHPRVLHALEVLANFPHPVRWKALVLHVTIGCLTTQLADILCDAPAWRGLRLVCFDLNGHHYRSITDIREAYLTNWGKVFQSAWFRNLHGLIFNYSRYDITHIIHTIWNVLRNHGPYPAVRYLKIISENFNTLFINDLPSLFQNINYLVYNFNYYYVYSSDCNESSQTISSSTPSTPITFEQIVQSLPPSVRSLEVAKDICFSSSMHSKSSTTSSLCSLRIQISDYSLQNFVQYLQQNRWNSLRSLFIDIERSYRTLKPLLDVIRQHPDLHQLFSLSLHIDDPLSRLSPRALEGFLNQLVMPQLRILKLGGFLIDADILHNMSLEGLPNLRVLDLRNCRLVEPIESHLAQLNKTQTRLHIVWPLHNNSSP